MNYDNFYKMLKAINDDAHGKIRSIHINPDLSESGRSKELQKVIDGRTKAVNGLRFTFDKEYSKRMDGIDAKLSNSSVSPVDKIKALMQRRITRDTNLMSLSGDDDLPILDDMAVMSALLDEVQGLRKDTENDRKLYSLGQRSESWHRKEFSTAMASGDLEYIERLNSSLDYMPDGDVADKLRSQYEPVINKLKLDKMDPSQKELLDEKASLERDKELFNYSIESVSRRGEYVDARGAGGGEPVNIIRPYSVPTQTGASSQGSE